MQNFEKIIEESVQFQTRLAQGAQVAAGLGEICVGSTPKELVDQVGGLRLYRYQPFSDTATTASPLLIIYALVNRPYIVDLHEQRSLVQGLLAEGIDLYLIDWGYPGPGDRLLNLQQYVSVLIDRCVDRTLQNSGAKQVNLLGICQGGTMSLCYSALQPRKVRNLVTMVTPVDFHTSDNMLAHWFREIDVDLLVDTMGNVPGTLLNSIFLSLRPYKLGVEKYLDFVKISDDPEKVENFMRMEKWIFDSPDQAGEMFRDFLKNFFHENRLVTGGLSIGGLPVDMKSVSQPLLNIFAKQDHLVPPASSQALKYLTGSKDCSELAYDTGHIGIYVSAKAGRDIPQRMANWLRERA
ncbi:MAG: class III poly(R)-hydroxyalkanoic acid synthase subunit PhaC [Acidiferrobacterales bacterium]|nr:class III poly(R)-hydroxyalkanoic acid synthase subunit PhaC [Acidiferrobacterales bacterium]